MTKKQIVLWCAGAFAALGLILIVIAVRESNRFIDKATPSRVSNTLVFSDEFKKTTLDSSKWNTCYETYTEASGGCSNHGNNESEWYTPAGVSMQNGALVLTATKQTMKGTNSVGGAQDYGFGSGMVASGSRTVSEPALWSGTYGYYEARMNVPAGKALWPAFWLLPVDHNWPPEIDVMELLGDKPNEVLSTYFWKGDPRYGQPKDTSTYVSPTRLTDSWHTYAVNWQPGLLEWYVDGVMVKQATGLNIPSKPMQIIFNLAVGGTLPGSPDETTPLTSQMFVDYVRVYSAKP